MSAALPTSAVVISKIASATSLPAAAISRTCSSYASPFERADAKIVGFVVTPTTSRSAISFSRPWPLIRSRERSSSQMLTPAAESAAVGVSALVSVMLMMNSFFLVETGSAAQGFLGGDDRVLGGQAVLLEQGLVVGGRAE